MPKRSVFLFILALVWPGLFFQNSLASEIEARTTITEAVVYRAKAQVIREGRAKVGPGEHRVVVRGITSWMEPGSLRLSGRAAGAVKVGGLEVERVYLSEADDPEIVRLKAEIEDLGEEQLRDAEEIKVISAHEKFLDSVAQELSRQSAGETRRGSLDLKGVKSLSEYLNAERRDAGLKRIEIDQRMEKRKNEIEALEKRLADLRSRLSRVRYDVFVSVSAEKETTFEFTLSYLARGASWRPAYIVRKAEGGVALEYFGEVTQTTGENWKGVRLSLSTARPALGVKPPELPPWHLDIARPRDYMMMEKAARARMPAAAAMQEAGAKEAERAPAAAEYTGTTALFRVPGRQEIPSQEGRQRFLVADIALDAEFTWLIRPEMKEFAYLTAKLKNSSDYPILRGAAETFVGPDFVGKALLEDAARGEEFEVGFGVDESVRVKREIVKDFRSEKFFGGRVKRALGVEVEVENHKGSSIQARVEERLPVSKNEKIQVELASAEPRPEVDEKKGLLTWTPALAPGAKKKLAFEIVITHPDDIPVTGL